MRERKKSWKDEGVRGKRFGTGFLDSQECAEFRYGGAQNLARETLGNFKIFGDFLDKGGTRQFLYLAHCKRHIGAPKPQRSRGSAATLLELFQKTRKAPWLLNNQSHYLLGERVGLRTEIKFRCNLIIEIG